MPFSRKNHYSHVHQDEFDLRIPLHPEDSFQHGITFYAKVSFAYS